MPGVKPPPEPLACPFTAEERDRYDARALAACADLPEELGASARQLIADLVHRPQVPGDMVTHARLLSRRATEAGASALCALLLELADVRGRQVADREPSWILGNPASSMKQAPRDALRYSPGR